MLEFWYRALAADSGIILVTSDRDALRQRLYAARRASGDADLDGLSLVLSPTDDNQLWIIKNGK
jgi:hypothetical protein